MILIPNHASAGGSSQNFSSLFEQRVQEIQLPNGLQFLVLQRTNAPIVSCHTHANVGAFDEVSGQTGMALSEKFSSVPLPAIIVTEARCPTLQAECVLVATDRWLSCKMVHGILLDERALHSAMQQP